MGTLSHSLFSQLITHYPFARSYRVWSIGAVRMGFLSRSLSGRLIAPTCQMLKNTQLPAAYSIDAFPLMEGEVQTHQIIFLAAFPLTLDRKWSEKSGVEGESAIVLNALHSRKNVLTKRLE